MLPGPRQSELLYSYVLLVLYVKVGKEEVGSTKIPSVPKKLYFGFSSQNPIRVFCLSNFKIFKLHARMECNCSIEGGIRIGKSIILIEFLSCELN